MKRIIAQSPKETRRFASFSNFRDSNRVRWSKFRHFVV